jgi:hypothetical protein
MTLVKGILIIAAFFIGAILLFQWDPLNLNPEGLNGESWLPALYFIPVLAALFFVYKRSNR